VKNPFQTLTATAWANSCSGRSAEGRKTRPNLEVGICGEHGGDPDSIEWCHMIGNNYVSCSPFRVPIARLAAAHAALKHRPLKLLSLGTCRCEALLVLPKQSPHARRLLPRDPEKTSGQASKSSPRNDMSEQLQKIPCQRRGFFDRN
jgi:hypothetical protein